MSVLPGSLDYLYYNGILDHIPYEAYEMSAPAMNGTQYLNMAQSANMYGSTDSFERNRNEVEQLSATKTYKNVNGKEVYSELASGDDFRQSITDAAQKTKVNITSISSVKKGLLSLGAIALTVFALCHGKKKVPASNGNSGFWSKLNPLKWFKK